MTTDLDGPLWVVGAAIVRDGRCLVARRSAAMPLPGAWELPGGKVEEGEDPRDAVAREILEELGLTIEVGAFVGRARLADPLPLVFDVFAATVTGGAVALAEHAEHRWVGPDELDSLEWAPADRPLLPELRELLETG